MGKLIICSEHEQYTKLENLLTNIFPKSYECSKLRFNLCVYHKLRIANQNYYEDGKNFIIGTGTYIYKNSIGKEALKKIFNDYGSTFEKHNMVGSFAIGIMKKGCFSLFIDEGSTYDIYFSLEKEKNEIVLSNTMYHVAYAKDDHEFNYDNLLMRSVCCVYPGNDTFCDDILRLSGMQTIVFCNGQWTIKEAGYKQYRLKEGDLWGRLKEKIGSLNNVFKKSGIFMTGGQDSRLYLSLMLALDLKPTLYYGKGNSFNTCTKQRDEEIVYEISQNWELPFIYMDWSESDKEGKEEYIDKYGEAFSIYSFNKNIFYEFEERIDTEFLCFGYCGEMYRNIEMITAFEKDIYTLDEYIDKLYISSNLQQLCSNYGDLRNRIYKSLLKVCYDKNMDPSRLSRGDFVKLDVCYRYRADMVMNNFANLFFYSAPFFGDGEIISILEKVDYKDKENSKFLMRGIERFTPGLIKVPFFSHIKEQVLNKDTFELQDKRMAAKYKEYIRTAVKNEKLLKLLRKLYYLIISDKKGRNELDQELAEKQAYIDKMTEIEWLPNKSKTLYNSFQNVTMETILLHDELLKHLCNH